MKHLNMYEREQIAKGFAQNLSRRQIADIINRHHTTIVRELNNNGRWPYKYSPYDANGRANELKRKAKKISKIEKCEELKKYIFKKLKLKWSPEQISNILKIRYKNKSSMQISHESIYTYIYLLPRGALRKELISFLRQGTKGRQKRKRGYIDRQQKIPNIISIQERPREVESRTVPGHWESDLIIGKDKQSALGTIVERTTRTTILVPLKAKTALEVRKSFAKELKTLPKEMVKSMTHDRGTEMTQHELFTKETKIQVYFADPYSPWQRGTNENTNGLLRQYFPKGTDFKKISRKEIKKVQHQLNERPRKTLNWLTPKETFAKLLRNGAINV